MGLFAKKEPEAYVHRVYMEEDVHVNKKNATTPPFSKLRGKIQRDDRYALDMFNQHVATPQVCREIIDEAKRDAIEEATNPLKKLVVKGYGGRSVCASTTLVPISEQSAMEMPMDLLWDYIFKARKHWWCFTLLYHCGAIGDKGEWSGYVRHLTQNDPKLTTWVNPDSDIPLPKQLDFISAMLGCMDPARRIMAFRITLAVAKLVNPETQEKLFEKMTHYLYPEVVFRNDPTAYKTSPWLNQKQSEIWAHVGWTTYTAIDRLDLALDSNYEAVAGNRGLMAKWCLRLCEYFAPPKDSKDYASFDAKECLDFFWGRTCVPLLELNRKRALDRKANEKK